ncbi:hypothetical protein GCM10009827_014830 [Dactylosporangium maewongense]|uniref:Uncharacterized protein n=1 Tax=Dactylosporangium maewongense TaxID=634393 RepID=A0ABN1ZRM2_9ACTN
MSEPAALDSVDDRGRDGGERGPGPVGMALLVSGFVLAAAAQYLPWASVDLRSAAGGEDEVSGPVPASIELDLASFNNGHVIAYLVTVALALVGVGVLAATRGPVRRAAAAAALGLLAGNALVLVGLKKAIEHVGGSALVSYRLPEETIHIGAGYPLAIAATVLLAAGVLIAARMLPDIGRRRPVDEPHDGAEPLELTVTPLQ